MTLETIEVWAPGSRRDITLAPVELHAQARKIRVAAGAVEELVSVDSVEDLDGLLRVSLHVPRTDTIRFTARFTVLDAVALWRPGSGQERGTLPPSWSDLRTARPLDGIPLGCLVGRDDTALVGFGVNAGERPVQVRAGMVEESGEFLVEVCITDAKTVEIVFDLRERTFAESVGMVGGAIGFDHEIGSPRDEQPVLCTWYSFHQDLVVGEILEDARIARDLGIGTLIIDDGWQTAEGARGYGSCGDWEVEASKISDPRALVSELEMLGLRTLWWIGTPFIGERAQAHRDSNIPIAYYETDLDAAVFDPRSPHAREALVQRLRELLRDTGAHGFKIDFLERFAVDLDAAPGDADLHTIEEGALRLLDDIAGLADDEPLMIELREPYITAATLNRGTMFRVADCPLSPLQNRRGIVDMRIMSPNMTVHGDPIMWSAGDTPERVAQQLVASLFGVPQLSVRLTHQSLAHREVLAHWLGFWNQHSAVLLHAPVDASGVDRDYAVVEVADANVTVTARYGDGPVTAPNTVSTWEVANGGEEEMIFIGLDRWGTVDVDLRDARGRVVASVTRQFDRVSSLAVPAGGRATVRPVS